MKINPELVEKIEKDLSIFGLAVCALNIVRYIAGRTVKSEFYISLSDFLKEIPNCSSSETEQVINYLATTTPPTLTRTYCFVDEESVFHELGDDALILFQESNKLYHPSSGKLVEEESVNIFLLYKTSIDKVLVQ
ncbi:hypothetical protein B1F73_13570 [Pseudomonas syringae]|uniref:Uncharacterized protein n=2 Tax=Pseudomonas syringae TaxID=317 RepID=A0AB37ZIH3_PSESX|nr:MULTISPECIES: hypothetical protein [Pseudomonas]MBI6668369.1 hypothetical protein [Pseudomonas syringae]MBI6679072.1 hypothetical protein [Pseudomonas syringae]MBI6839522.1 hypothetical protein [Pseudomonas syringae]MDC3736057.1 hypothetical protein [Pseudomonas syringae pv. syringae]NAP05771.1 hypothetical protein [Pseudomonas syringae]